MSIVEKALNKLQSSARPTGESQASARRPAATPNAAITNSPVATQTITAEPLVVAPLAVVDSIVLDEKKLQAAGIMTPDSGAIMIRNQFRRLKWSLLDAMETKRVQAVPNAGAVMVTSALPEEGKTFTCINLAMSMAREEDYRVILIDADVAKGHITNLFGLQDRPGLMELLSDTSLRVSDVLIKTNFGNLYVLPAGKFRPHVAEMLASARMPQIVAELAGESRGRVAIFDSSPMLATNAAQVLGRVLPQILFVVRAETTTQAAVREALDLLDRSKVSAVLNQSHLSAGGENYNQNYGYYGNEEQ